MVRGTVNGGGGLVLGSTGPLDAGRAHSEGGNGGLDSGEHWGRSREWTKKNQQKLTDSLRFFVTKGRDDYFLFWVSFLHALRVHGWFTFFVSMFFFPFAVSFYRPFPFAHLLVAIKWTVYGTAWFGGAVVGYWELLEGGFFAHSINGINEATFLYFGGVLCVFNFI